MNKVKPTSNGFKRLFVSLIVFCLVVGTTLLMSSATGKTLVDTPQMYQNDATTKAVEAVEIIDDAVNAFVNNYPAFASSKEEFQKIDAKKDKIADNYIDANVAYFSGQGQGVIPEDPQKTLMDLEHEKWSWIIQQLVEIKAEEERQLVRKRDRERVRIWLEHVGSPLSPYTEWMQTEADRVGSNVYMCAAVSMAESSCGLVNMAPHNGWGLMAHPGGFGSWEEGISAFYDFILVYDIQRGYPAVDGHSCPNYCEPNEPWMTHVDGCVQDIRAVDPGF